MDTRRVGFMNLKERFKYITSFKKPDRGIYCEWAGFWDETLIRWKTEGLPLYIQQRNTGAQEDINRYFDFDPYYHGAFYTTLRTISPIDKACSIGIDFWPIPRFIPEVLEENDRYIIARDSRGITTKTIKSAIAGSVMPTFIEHPVKTRDDWEEMKKRFDSSDPRRYPIDWGEKLIEYYNTTHDRLVGMILPGFYIMPWHLMGIERLSVVLYEDPDFFRDMIGFLSDFYIETMREAFKAVKLDFISIWEDFAYNKGPVISPKMIREFMLPAYKKIIRFSKHYGVDLIGLDSDGNINTLIPMLLDAGINWYWPLEAAANMDAVVLREKYGKKIRLLQGNINKISLAQGREEIEKEVDYKLKILDEGGYIPHIDHHVPSDVPFKNYLYYNKLLKEYLHVEKY